MNGRRSANRGRRTAMLGGILAMLAGGGAFAGTWTVDGSNPACSDSGPGTAASPLCTIQSAANKAIAGDTVSVKPGTYREQVTPKLSGTPDSPIMYLGSPGVLLLGNTDLSDTLGWTAGLNGAWSRPLSVATKQVTVDGVRLSAAASLDTMTAGSFFYDPLAAMLYVNTDGNNPGAPHVVEASVKTYGFNVAGLSNLVIDGFGMKSQNSAGVRLFNASNVIVRNIDTTLPASYGVRLEASTGPVTVEKCNVSFAGSNGILVLSNTNATVRSNISHDNGFHGISLQASSSNLVTGNTCYKNVKPLVRSAAGIDVNQISLNNVIQANTTYENQDSGIQVYNGSDNNLVTRNVSYANGDHGFDTNKSMGTRYVSNTASGNFKDGFSIEGSSTNTFMANNISVNNGLTTAEFDLYVDELSTAGFFSDFDVIYNNAPNAPIKVNGIIYSTLNAFKAASVDEAHGVSADPVFVDPIVGDFRLGPSSPVLYQAYCEECGANDPWVSVVVGISAPSTAFVNKPASISGAAQNIDPASIATYAFNFGDGTTAPAQSSPVIAHTFVSRGMFAVSTTICDFAGDCASASTPIVVTDIPPIAALIVNPGAIIATSSVAIDASGSSANDGSPITSYAFDFGDGSTSGAQASPLTNHVFGRAGLFTVKVTVTNLSGMTAVTTQTVNVTDSAPTASLLVDQTAIWTNTTVNANASASFVLNGAPIATFKFDFGDGAVVGPQASPLASHLYTRAGSFTVKVSVTGAGGMIGTATRLVVVTLDQAPLIKLVVPKSVKVNTNAKADATGTLDRETGVASYRFDFGDGFVTAAQASPIANHVYTSRGNFDVTVTVTDTRGNISQMTKRVQVKLK